MCILAQLEWWGLICLTVFNVFWHKETLEHYSQHLTSYFPSLFYFLLSIVSSILKHLIDRRVWKYTKKYKFICLALGCFGCSPYIMVLSHFAFKNSHKHCESTLPIVRLWTITRIRPKAMAFRLNHKVALNTACENFHASLKQWSLCKS